MPYATRFLTILLLGQLLLLVLFWGGPQLQKESHQMRLTHQRRLVARLGLTDLSLFTEAPYTRHLSLATTTHPFQDHPFATAHFPTGSLVPPPARLLTASTRKGAP